MNIFKRIGIFVLMLAVLFVSCKTNIDSDDVVLVTSVKLDKTDLDLTVGQTFDLTATVLPEDANEKSVTWASSKPEVAKVENGRVTALAKGEAIITVTTKDAGKTAMCSVTVSEKNVEPQNPEEGNPSESETQNPTEEDSELSDVILTFNANGGAWSDGTNTKTISGKPNAAFTAPDTPVKTGYKFTGWNPALPEKIPQANATYTATWTLAGNFIITYELNGGTNSAENPTGYNIETETFELKSATKIGYTFCGWYKDAEFTTRVMQIEKGSTGDITLYAKWNANAYKVVFDANGGSGTMSEQIFTYDVEQQLNANEFMRTGYNFAGWSTSVTGGVSYNEGTTVNNLSAESDGIVMLYAIWAPEGSYKITYELNGGTNGNNPAFYTVETETFAFASPTKLGYKFIGWYKESSFVTKITQIEKGSTGDITLYAKWEAAQVNYTVEHLQENLDGNGFTKFESQTLTGTTGSQTAATAKSYTGFTAQEITQSTIAADGSTVVQVKYTRNTVALTFKDGDTVLQTISGKYGANISVANPTNIGYTFMGWNPTLPATFTESKIYTATWKAAEVNYTVEHLQENLDGNGFTKFEGQTLTGTTGTQTAATAKSYTGFTAQEITQATIAADGSTVVQVKYTRNTVALTFKDGDTVLQTISGKYGANISVANPTKTGYSFMGWNPTLPATFTESKIYTATWKAAEVNYTVEHLQENLDGNGFAKSESQTLTGTTGTQTAATAKSYTGFTAQEITQSTIAADGSTIVQIKYARNNITLTLNLDGGIGETSVSGKYGTNVSVSLPTKDGYIFTEWSPSLPETFEKNESYTATWEEGYLVTASDVAEKIRNLVGETGTYKIKVTGAIDASTITAIESALLAGNVSENPTSKIEIDFSETTGLTSIGNNAFQNCYMLVKVIMPESVISIGENVFSNCKNLASVTIGSGVTSIGSGIVYVCYNLDSIYVDNMEQWCRISSNNLSSYGKHIYVNNIDIKTASQIVIPDTVTVIGDYAFSSCKGLTKLTIPDSVTSIGYASFSYCQSLTSLTIPGSVTSVGNVAFYQCNALTSLTISEGVESVGADAFGWCKKLTNITIPDTVTSIGNMAFEDCIELTSVTIGSGVTSIGTEAFATCTKLTSVTVKATTPPTLGKKAFNNDNNYKIYVPAAAVSVYKKATNWSDYASYIYPIQ